MLITASSLFAQGAHRPGEHKCFFCGVVCDDSHKAIAGDSFTNRDIVKAPGSGYMCVGCEMARANNGPELAMRMIDGTIRECKTLRAAAPRLFSWLITRQERLAFTKAHISHVRDMLMEGRLPAPPFALIMADSGQKQLIFRAPVALDADNFPVMLEEEIVDVSLAGFRQYMELASAISTKIGQPKLKERVSMSAIIQADKHGVAKQLQQWGKIQNEPLGRLVAWLAPPKEK